MARTKQIPPLVERPHSDWNRLRIRRGLSLRQLEAETGIGRGTLSYIDSGRLHPSAEQSAELLRVLRPDHPGAARPPADPPGPPDPPTIPMFPGEA